MANKKISSMTELATTPASGDKVPLVDVSDTTGAATGTTKWVSVDNLVSEIAVADLAASAVVLESEGIGSNDNDTTLPTSAAVKDYVDTNVTAQDLDFQGDSGGALAIDLDSESLTIAGGTGISTVGLSKTVTASIDSTVATLTGSQTLTNKTLTSPVIDTGVSGSAVLDSDTMSGASATTLATSESIKAYVDAQTHLELGTSSSTALAGDTTTISSGQASAIVANTAKTGITSGQASEITANTAKTGITSGQASAIVANTAKVSNATHTGEVTGDTALTVADDVIDEANLKGVGTATNDHVLTADSTATGGMKWAASGAPEGTAVLSTEETGGTKFLREDGDGTCSWATPSGSGDVIKVGTPVTGQVGYWTGNGTLAGENALFWDASNDRLGIGGTPTTKFELFGSNGNVQIAADGNTVNYTRDGSNYLFANAGSSSALQLQGQHSLQFSTGASQTERLRINSAGNVGINTTAPSQKLHVEGGQILSKNASGDASMKVWAGGTSDPRLQFTVDGATDYVIGLDNSDSDALKFCRSSSVGTSTQMTIDSSGLVGIGTSSLGSGRRLTVAGGAIAVSGQNLSHSASNMVLGQESTAISQIRFYGADTSTAGILQFEGTSSDGSVGGERMRIDSVGRVGIGGTPSSRKLEVFGDASFGANSYGVLEQDSTTVRFKNSTTGEVHLMTHDGAEDINLNSAGYIQMETAGTERLRIDSAGLVGISTAAPTRPLHVVSANSAAISTACLENSSGGDASLWFKTDNEWAIGADKSDSNSFKISNSSELGSNDRLSITTAGLIGVGTTPTSKLDVLLGDDGVVKYKSAAQTLFEFWKEGSTEEARMQLKFNGATKIHLRGNGDSYFNGGNVGIGTGTIATTTKLIIRTNTNNNFEFEDPYGTLRFSAMNDARDSVVPLEFAASEFKFLTGNVGIGKTPTTVLDIADDGNGLRLSRGTVDLRLSDNVTNGNVGTESNHNLNFRTNSADRMTITSGGRVTVKKSSNSEITALSSSSNSTAVDMNAADNFSLALAENTTLAQPSNITAGQSGAIVITQDGTGSRTMAYHAYWHFEGGTDPTLSTAGGSVDTLVYYVASTDSIHAVLLKDMK